MSEFLHSHSENKLVWIQLKNKNFESKTINDVVKIYISHIKYKNFPWEQAVHMLIRLKCSVKNNASVIITIKLENNRLEQSHIYPSNACIINH